MDLRDLVNALVSNDGLFARQWVMDAVDSHLNWSAMPKPEGLSAAHLAIAAGLAEMLAARSGSPPPPWTDSVPAAPEAIVLVPSLLTMPRFRQYCEEHGPEPLRRRRVVVPPDFLTAA